MMDFKWFEISTENYYKTKKEIWNPIQPINIISLVLDFPGVAQQIEQKISGISENILIKVQEEVTEETKGIIDKKLFLGGGLAHVEHRSGLMIKGLIHPSIHNAFSLAKEKGLPASRANLSHAADKAVEVGYGILRFSNEPSETFFANLRRLNS